MMTFRNTPVDCRCLMCYDDIQEHTCRLAGVTELLSISFWSCRRQKFETPIDFVRPSFWHSIIAFDQNTQDISPSSTKPYVLQSLIIYALSNLVTHLHCRVKGNKQQRYIEIGKKIIRNKGTKLWNDLPDDIKQITSPLLFKFRLKCYMLQLLQQ